MCIIRSALIFIVFALPLTGLEAFANSNLLKGEYEFTRFRNCLVNQDGFNTDTDYSAKSLPIFGGKRGNALRGTLTFDGVGAGTLVGTGVTMRSHDDTPPVQMMSKYDSDCTFTYFVESDDSFVMSLTCEGKTTDGRGATTPPSITMASGIEIGGKISNGGAVLVLADVNLNEEKLSPAGGADFYRICTRSGTAIRK